MKRVLIGLFTAAMVALTTAPAGAAPNIYHTISSTHGSAAMVETIGCERTEIFVSSMVGMFAAQPGPVNKQGLTSVFVRISDVCAAPGRGVVLFQADGMNFAPLEVDPRLTSASITTDIAGTDGDGNPVTISLSTSWTGTGPLEHSTVSSHENIPGLGNVNSTDNNLRRAATATGSVTVNGLTAAGTDSNAVLERVKGRCIEIARQGVEDFFPCFGFPG